MTRPTAAHTALAAVAGVAALIALTTGCRSIPTMGSGAAQTVTIECQVFCRPSMGESFQESIISLGPENDSQSAAFDDLTYSAQYMDDAGEGPSLSLVVSDRRTEKEIARQLYQIDRSKGLANQFIGGHGFTGLNYVFHPTSPAELQYFCLVK